jgi:lipopolysaccharide biosynthesis regulator YciM
MGISTYTQRAIVQKSTKRLETASHHHQSESAEEQIDGNNADVLLDKAIEHNQIILARAEILKQKAWEDNKNYVAAVRDLDTIISQTRESSNLLQMARKCIANNASPSKIVSH